MHGMLEYGPACMGAFGNKYFMYQRLESPDYIPIYFQTDFYV